MNPRSEEEEEKEEWEYKDDGISQTRAE